MVQSLGLKAKTLRSNGLRVWGLGFRVFRVYSTKSSPSEGVMGIKDASPSRNIEIIKGK